MSHSSFTISVDPNMNMSGSSSLALFPPSSCSSSPPPEDGAHTPYEFKSSDSEYPPLGLSLISNPRNHSRSLLCKRHILTVCLGCTLLGLVYGTGVAERSWNAMRENLVKNRCEVGTKLQGGEGWTFEGASSRGCAPPISNHLATTQTMAGTAAKRPRPLLEDHVSYPSRPSDPFEPLPTFAPHKTTSPSHMFQSVNPFPHPIPSALDPNAKYLVYSPHSGFHNQRIAMQNAFILAKLLNRTLILPPARLGKTVGWAVPATWQRRVDNTVKKTHLECLQYKSVGAGGTRGGELPKPCLYYGRWSEVGWQYLFNLSSIVGLQPVIDRWDGRTSWLWEKLNLQTGDWAALDDPDRFSYEIFEDVKNPKLRQWWSKAIDIEDLRAYSHVKLLSMGSLFGKERIVSENSETKRWILELRKAQVCRHEALTKASDAIAERLGGRGKYLSFHLRVGDSYFKARAAENMNRVLTEALASFFKLPDEAINILTQARNSVPSSEKSSRRSPNRQPDVPGDEAGRATQGTEDEDGMIPDPTFSITKRLEPVPKAGSVVSTSPSAISPSLQCRGRLHTSPSFRILNLPVYIATDSRTPLTDPNLKILFNTFPCAFILSDFISSKAQGIGELAEFENLRSLDDGLRLAKFLYPLLEAIVAAKGSGFLGTPMSTFSRYSSQILYPTYFLEAQNEHSVLNVSSPRGKKTKSLLAGCSECHIEVVLPDHGHM